MNSHLRFIAHRGYSAVEPENTTAAFQAALDYNDGDSIVSGIELDVQLSRDGEVVVFHDADLKRMCGCDKLVAQVEYAELVEIARQCAGLGGQSISLLSEVLAQVAHKKAIYCEIKVADYDWAKMVGKLAELAERYAPQGDLIFHSFSADMLQKVIGGTEHLDVKYGFLFGKLRELGDAKGLIDKLDYLHPHFECLLQYPDEVFSYGKKINTWTVDKAEDLQRIRQLEKVRQVEGVITNDLSIAAK